MERSDIIQDWSTTIIRMEEERIPKRVLNGNWNLPYHETSRKTKNQMGRYMVKRDALQWLGIREWRSKAANRDEWRRLMRAAKAWKGL
jgi:hypothetical protein